MFTVIVDDRVVGWFGTSAEARRVGADRPDAWVQWPDGTRLRPWER